MSVNSDRERGEAASPFEAFLSGEDGSATMEIVLWLPVLAFLIALTVDASVLYFRQGEMFNVARDAARGLAAGSLLAQNGTLDAARVDTFVDTAFGADVVVDVSETASTYTVTITRGAQRLSPFNILEPLIPRLTATVVMSKER